MKKIKGLKKENFEVYELKEDWNLLKELNLFKQILFILFKKKYKSYIEYKDFIKVNECNETGVGRYVLIMEQEKLTCGNIEFIK